MKPDELIAARQADWERLSNLVTRAQRGPLAAMSESELVELGQLYRRATSDLAIAQRDFPRHSVGQYLNQLVGRAHPLVYRGEPLLWRQLKDFYLRQYPQLYRELAPFLIVSAMLFLGLAVVFYFVTLANPAAGEVVVPPSLVSLIKRGSLWFKQPFLSGGVDAALLMTNNLRVALFAFAGGMLLGLVTIYILVTNGLLLGGVMGLMQVYGHAAPMWEFVIGHGVLELSEIVMAGASGLLLGYAMVHPGLLSRRDALTVAGQKAVRLMLGSAPLLIVAGIIEGLLSPSDASAWIKYAVGITSGILLYGYLLGVGRTRAKET